MRKLLLLIAVSSLTSCTIQKVYVDGKVQKEQTKLKVLGYEVQKAK